MALAAQNPAWGAQMEYESGESSDSEIDGLDDDDLVPPWLTGAAVEVDGSGSDESDGSDDY